MSWDIVLFNLAKNVKSVEEINDELLLDFGSGHSFKQLVTECFPNAQWKDDNWCSIETPDYSIQFSLGNLDDRFAEKLIHLYGEKAIYPIIDLCRKFGWQLFDTGNGKMIDINMPEKNGFTEFQSYLDAINKKE
jgi:hypothetical protein